MSITKDQPAQSQLSRAQLAEKLCAGFAPPETQLVENALDTTLSARADLDRPRGIDVALILKRLKADPETIQAALLTDPPLREAIGEQFVREHYGETVATLVRNVNWLNTFHQYSPEIIKVPEQAETLRRMLLSMTSDVRAVLIKLAFRVRRLRILARQDTELRRYIAQETMDIYAPLANRLGVGQLKWELEDLAFRYLEPGIYKKLVASLAENRTDREAYIQAFVDRLSEALEAEGIKAKVYGRPKHIYSIWRKMQRKQVELNELFDLLAVRIIVDKISTCYETLGIVHTLWQYIPKEFDDYIANPKSNGYQSLHTVVIGPEGATIEIQIRTRDMHEFGELGVAAHWRYKEGGKQDAAVEKSIASLRRLLEDRDDEHMLDDFHTELFADRIFVLTPKGEIVDMLKGATPLDFAYAIHTEVGHRCRGAKVNGRIVPLSYTLNSGERVEILTGKEVQPIRNWLDPNMGYLKTTRSLSKVKAWFRQQDHQQNLLEGKAILDKERQRLGLGEIDIDELARHFHYSRGDDLLVALGRADINNRQIAAALSIPELSESDELPLAKPSKGKGHDGGGVSVYGIGNMLTTMARCCNPVQGDAIVGYITKGKGIAVHRQECPNILQLDGEKRARLIEVDWGEQGKSFQAAVAIEAFDRRGLLNEITQILSSAHINILDANVRTSPKDLSANIDLTVEIKDTAQLSQVLNRISQLNNVVEAKRKV